MIPTDASSKQAIEQMVSTQKKMIADNLSMQNEFSQYLNKGMQKTLLKKFKAKAKKKPKKK